MRLKVSDPISSTTLNPSELKRFVSKSVDHDGPLGGLFLSILRQAVVCALLSQLQALPEETASALPEPGVACVTMHAR